jgi:hypothetical protein
MPRPGLGKTLTRNAAVIGGLVTAIVAVVQLARSVSQSVREFEWKQAEQGGTLVKAMLTDEGWDAMTMLDFSEGRTYEIGPDTKVLIRPSDVLSTLKNSTSERAERTETQRFIIDRYDRLFFLVSQLQVAIRSGLVRKSDVAFPLSWYVEKRLCRHKQVLLDYMKENAAPETIEFFASLDSWARCSADTSTATRQ